MRTAGTERQRRLLAAFGPPDCILRAGRAALGAILGDRLVDRFLSGPEPERIEDALRWAGEDGNHVLALGDPDYPASLLDAPDPPVLLYAKGEPVRLARPALAIVGARSATPQGLATARAFARSLAGAGLAIVSGLASGIDAAAHEGALDADGTTIAVIGTGADRIYPAGNRQLAHRVAETGVIVSEYPLGTPAMAGNFPRRNRIIAGLARGALVVEAALGSGSLITARLAAECGREVFAIPGSIHSPLSKGCHRLIRDGAKLVETAQDVIEELRWAAPGGSPEASGTPREDLPVADPEQEMLLEAMAYDPVEVDTLVHRTGLTADSLYAILLAMELEGRVARLAGGRFQRL
jgi:DNA processing protein